MTEPSVLDLVNEIRNTAVSQTPPTTPVAPPTGEPTPPSTEFVAETFFGEEYKGKTVDDIKASVREAAELKAKLSETPPMPKFASKLAEEYDAWVRNGGTDDYSVFKTVKSTGADMNDIDALIAQKIIEEPAYVGMEKQLKDQILSKYQIEATEENGLTPEQVEFNKRTLSVEAKKAKEFLNKQVEKLQVQQTPTGPTEEQVKQRNENWDKAKTNVVSKLQKINIPITKKDGEKTAVENYMEFSVPQDMLESYSAKLTEQFSANVDVSEQTVQSYQGLLVNSLIVDLMPQIIKSAVDKREAELIDEYDKKYAGHVLKDPGNTPPGSTTPKAQDAYIASLFGS